MCINDSVLKSIGFKPFDSSFEQAWRYAIYASSKLKYYFSYKVSYGAKSEFIRYSLFNLRHSPVNYSRYNLRSYYGGFSIRAFCDVPTLIAMYSSQGSPVIKNCSISHRIITYSFAVKIRLTFSPFDSPPLWWGDEGYIDSDNSAYDLVSEYLSDLDISILFPHLRYLLSKHFYPDNGEAKLYNLGLDIPISSFDGSLLYESKTGSGSSEMYDGLFKLSIVGISAIRFENYSFLESFSCGCSICPESFFALDSIKKVIGG